MKGSIIILPHPPEVIEVDPNILKDMKIKLSQISSSQESDSLVDRP